MRTFVTTLVLGLSLAATVDAQTPWFDLPTPNGALQSVQIELKTDRSMALARAMRVLHGTPRTEELSSPISEFEQRLATLDAFEQETQRLGSRGLSLSMAGNSSERDVLRDVLKTLGLQLRERRGVYAVEADRDKDAVALRQRLSSLGIDTVALEAQLNAGAAVPVAPAVMRLPSPLPLETWTTVIFERAIPARSVFGAIARDRSAALLLIGLNAMTPPTRDFLIKNPDLLRHLYRDAQGAVAGFGEALQIDPAGRLVLPGGADATPLWEGLVDEKIERVDRFTRALFDRDGGRLAFFVYMVSRLDEARQKFALGLWNPDRAGRLDRFRALYRTFADVDPNWSVTSLPFRRPLYDPSMLLGVVQVNATGSPSAPALRKFWTKALDGMELPAPGAREFSRLGEDGLADAAWLAEQTVRDRPAERRAVLERIAFGQRVFASAGDGELDDVLTALRAFGRYPALMLATERIGVRTPSVFAAVARRARDCEEITDAALAVPVIAQFQGGLAILERLARTGAVDPVHREALVRSLAAQEVSEGRYRGAIGRWFSSELLPSLPRGEDDAQPLESALLKALADRTEVQTFEWEDAKYVADITEVSISELTAMRARQGGNTVDAVLAFSDAVRTLEQPNLTLEAVKTASTALKTVGSRIQPLRSWPDVEDQPSDVRKLIDRAVRDLDRLSKPKDADKAVRIVRPLAQMVDELLAETLVALAYAPWLGSPSAVLGPQVDISHRHRFGLRTQRRTVIEHAAWQPTAPDTERVEAGGFTGSLLSLDLVNAANRLRRLASNSVPTAPRLNANDVKSLSESLVLMNPREVSSSDLLAVGEAVARGRKRVREATDAAALEALAHDVAMPGDRRQALGWTLSVESARVDRLFSMSELLSLGRGNDGGPSLDPWGTTAEPLTGCFCLRYPGSGSWSLLSGRQGTSLLGASVPDVTLRIAEHLASLRVPAALVAGVAGLATQAFIDTAPPLYDDDWVGIVGHAHELTRETVEDYVAAVVANGPVRPAGGGSIR
jgi:hypothetical protein